MIMKLAAARRRPLTLLTVVLAVALLLMADCERKDPGPYDGGHIWKLTSVSAIQPGRTPMYALPSTTHVGILGDSIDASAEIPLASDHFDIRLAEALRIPSSMVLNGAVSGLTLTGPHPNLADLAPAFLATLSPGDVLVIDIGMNDACNGAFNLSAFSAALLALAGQSQALGLRVLIGQVTPVVPALAACEAPREAINNWEWSAFPHSTVIQYATVLAAAGQVWIEPRKAMPDGKHPDEGGTAEMADMTSAAILAPAVTFTHHA